MLGNLVVTFYERGSGRSTEIWAFPDLTLNVVVSEGAEEWPFPCSSLQLQRVLQGVPVRLRVDDFSVTLSRVSQQICVDVDCGPKYWRQCIDAEPFEEAMATLESEHGFVA